jgi:hydrogenase-1 operon protein HyaE
MRHPLIQRLHDEFGYPEVTLGNHGEFVAPELTGVLFFAGDPKRYKETTDVAVVLPELVAAFGGRMRPAVVASADEVALQKHYGFRAWPSLVFVRSGGYVGTVSRMKDWVEYLEEIAELLTAEPREAPGFKVLKDREAPSAEQQDGAAR